MKAALFGSAPNENVVMLAHPVYHDSGQEKFG